MVVSSIGLALETLHGTSRWVVSTILGAFLCSTTIAPATGAQLKVFTVAQAIETARLLEARSTTATSINDNGSSIFVSPSGERYVAFVVQGNIRENRIDVTLLAGSLADARAGRPPRAIAHINTTGYGTGDDYGSSALVLPNFNTVEWISEDRIAFLWEDERHIRQVFAADVRSGSLQSLTDSVTDVRTFDAANDGSIFYSAQAPQSVPDWDARVQEGFAVSSTDALNILGRGPDDWLQKYASQRFLKRPAVSARLIENRGRSTHAWVTNVTKLSPNGRWAVFTDAPAAIPPEWSRYDSPLLHQAIAEARAGHSEGSLARQISVFYLLDTETLTTRPLFDAPAVLERQYAVWSPDSKLVLIGPTFTTRGSEPDQLRPTFVVVDPAENSAINVPLDPQEVSQIREITWVDNRTIQLCSEASCTSFVKDEGGDFRRSSAHHTPQEPVRLLENINLPPRLVYSRGRHITVLLDLNPELDTRSLAWVSPFAWNDRSGRQWHGLLYSPPSCGGGTRCPLVIQTHGLPRPNTFSLYGSEGPGTGPGTSSYSAQALAARGIMVLQVEDQMLPGISMTPSEPGAYTEAYDAAVDALSRSVVDRSRVGLFGYSRTGWHVEYALVHGRTPFAAAVVSDNADMGYMQAALVGWPTELNLNNGAEPFGTGLESWVANAPPFAAEKIKTPLRLQVESGGLTSILIPWEMFSRLRAMGKAVELYVSPNIDRGSHGSQNPSQVLALQEGMVDWFDFWLNNRENSQSSDAGASNRWRILRDRQCHSTTDAQPYCVAAHH